MCQRFMKRWVDDLFLSTLLERRHRTLALSGPHTASGLFDQCHCTPLGGSPEQEAVPTVSYSFPVSYCSCSCCVFAF